MSVESRIPLNEKRFLDVKEFCAYVSLGQNRARDLIYRSGCDVKVGRRLLVDRARFDEWCNSLGYKS